MHITPIEYRVLQLSRKGLNVYNISQKLKLPKATVIVILTRLTYKLAKQVK